MWKAVGMVAIITGVLSASVGYMLADVHASPNRPESTAAVATAAVETPAPPSPEPTPTPVPVAVAVPRSFAALTAQVDALVAASGATVGVSLVEYGGKGPVSWQDSGATKIDAASTYKLAVLMDEAQLIGEGKLQAKGVVCFQDSDYEDGWYDDYATGDCYTRDELAMRAGLFSDNTAGHMLVRDLGGVGALNVYAAEQGAQDSTLYDPNFTTAEDLTALLTAEATGKAGGAAAMAWLYPKLTDTHFEAGIPAGVPAGRLVIHKTGQVDAVVDDAGIVTGGANGPYALAVLTDGAGGDAGWQLIADISAAVWSYEAAR